MQNAVVTQIAHPPDPAPYLGAVDYSPDSNGTNQGHAPWFDWGPYLWAYGEAPRQDGFNWCKGQGDNLCSAAERDVIDGDLTDSNYWGDFTHPAGPGVAKVAGKLVNFIQTSPWVTPWISTP